MTSASGDRRPRDMFPASSNIHIGTSGWTYDDWTGPFYPEEVRGAERLSFYASRFDTVEVNATFYRYPTSTMLEAWNRRLPPEFHMVVKGHRAITHLRKLGTDRDSREALAGFLGRVVGLRTLRVILWQLPPSLHRDLDRLNGFLRLLRETAVSVAGTHTEAGESGESGAGREGGAGERAGRIRHAVEFRHASWWDEDVAAVLGRHEVAFVAVSHPRLPEDVLATADFLYLRFHGKGRHLYDYDYSDEELASWRSRLAPHLGKIPLYAFFNNDWHANAPRNAATFRRMLAGG